MQGKDHREFKVRNCGQRHFISLVPDYTNPTEKPQKYPIFSSYSCKRSSSLTIWDTDSTPWWLWNQQWHPSRKNQRKATLWPRCLLLPPVWQAPLQPYPLLIVHWNVESVEILRPSTFFTLPSLHFRCFTSSDTTGQSQQVSQHHNVRLRPSHSATCWDKYSPPVHNTEHATCTDLDCTPPLPTFFFEVLPPHSSRANYIRNAHLDVFFWFWIHTISAHRSHTFYF